MELLNVPGAILSFRVKFTRKIICTSTVTKFKLEFRIDYQNIERFERAGTYSLIKYFHFR